MDEDERAVNLLLNTLARIGNKRCDRQAQADSSAVLPAKRQAIWRERQIKRWLESLTPQQLATYNMELLCRAESLVKFISANAGPSIEFPIVISAETEQTASELASRCGDLDCIINFLVEI